METKIPKKSILTAVLFLGIAFISFGQNGFPKYFPQELKYEIRSSYKHPVQKENLKEAKLLGDFIPDYPKNWISKYILVEIVGTCNGKTVKALNASDVLSVEQKKILNAADLATDILVNVKYNYKDPITSDVENNYLNISLTVIQKVYEEAEYTGGLIEMKRYIKENILNKLSKTIPVWFQSATVVFTVNETGEIGNARLSRSSGDKVTDELFLREVNKLPKWKPAENSKGIKVKQEFEFSVYSRSSEGC